MFTIKSALLKANKKLAKASSTPRLDAEVLLLHILKEADRTYLYAHAEKKLSKKQILLFDRMIKRRFKHEPIAYITGHKEFYGLPFLVSRTVLIPRPDTEIMVETAINQLNLPTGQAGNKTIKQENKIEQIILIDIGTGSGCIPIAILKNLNDCQKIQCFAIDNSKKSLMNALINAKLNKVKDKIIFLSGNLLNPIIELASKNNEFLTAKSNLIITANLPYISTKQYKKLPLDIRKYEPKNALTAGLDGLKYYRELFKQIKIISQKIAKMSNILIFIEIDPEQNAGIQKIIKSLFPKADVSALKDLAGTKRVVQIFL